MLPTEELISNDETIGKFSVSRSGRLLIRRTEIGDAGVYRCITTIPCDRGNSENSSKNDRKSRKKISTEVSECDDVVDIRSIRVAVVKRAIDEDVLSQIGDFKKETLVEGEAWKTKCPIEVCQILKISKISYKINKSEFKSQLF